MLEKTERNNLIFIGRLNGNTYIELAKEYGLSGSRIRQIHIKQARISRIRSGKERQPDVWELYA